jgi:hypothetical protein
MDGLYPLATNNTSTFKIILEFAIKTTNRKLTFLSYLDKKSNCER